ncbi:MAG: biopolymer transporter ExbD [Myxococcales bacterium]|nr:biopolymer transporter ExbD [Myxococcales bacterium]|tara:strand:- start:738 stop:1166 length:429 start_codon:yes stop_codon:yes gene_type:complete
MAGTNLPRRGIISGINVTPLVDVTLVLLIIFIVTAKIVVTPAVPLDLPRASEGQELQVVFSVLLPKDGRILVNGSVVANQYALEKRASAALKDDDTLRAVIQADGDVPHREVIAILDALKRAGVSRIAFGALPIDPAEGQAP